MECFPSQGACGLAIEEGEAGAGASSADTWENSLCLGPSILRSCISLLWLVSEDLAMVLFLHWPFHQETGSREARQKQVRNRKSSSQVR